MNIQINQSLTTPQLRSDRLKNKMQKYGDDRLHRRFAQDGKYRFNPTVYCLTYCTIIMIGVLLGGWSGGLFEFLFNSHNGCTNEHRGMFKCQIRYASLNVTTQCINIFYKKSILIDSPYICLCRFRHNPTSKYRDCEFLYSKIQ